MRRRRTPKPLITDGVVSYRLRDDALDIAVANATCLHSQRPCNAEVYAPRDKQVVPHGGGWAMITRDLPPMESNLDAQIPVGRVFYLEHLSHADREGFLPDGAYKVLTHSPWGDVCLWPYEYTVLPPALITDLWTQGGFVFHPINVQASTYNAIVFYARSRGLSLEDATVMALGTMRGPVGWFEPCDEVREFVAKLQDVGSPILTEENHRRRQAARATRPPTKTGTSTP